jgi:hypothetical protein
MGESSYHLKCQSCATLNRVRQKDIHKEGRCGKCGSRLTKNDVVPINVTDSSWDREIYGTTIPAIVEVWGQNCSVCHRYEPQVRAMAKNLYPKARLLKLQAELNPIISNLYKIRGVCQSASNFDPLTAVWVKGVKCLIILC